MPFPEPRTAGRVPQARVLRNDATIRDAALAIIVQRGWTGLTLNAVAVASGLSLRALSDRFANSSALAAGVWTSRCDGPVTTAMAALLGAAGLLDTPPSAADLGTSLNALAHPDPVLQAAAELLLISPFDSLLHSAIDERLGAQVSEWLTPRPAAVTRALAGRRAYLLALGLGLMLAGRRPGIEGLDFAEYAPAVAAAAASGTRPTRLPTTVARHLDRAVPFDSGDPIRDALLLTALTEVGSRGFDGTGTRAIARAAGCSEGALFNRYRTKLDLFLDATRRQLALSMRANQDFLIHLNTRYGPPIAEAVLTREFLKPDRERLRSIATEQLRLSWHEPNLMAATVVELDSAIEEFISEDPEWTGLGPARIHVAYALGLGIAPLATLHPDAWRLPFDVMCVPLDAL